MRILLLSCVIFLGCSVKESTIEEQYRYQSKCVKYSIGKQVYRKHGDHWDLEPPYNVRPLERFSIKCIN